jgi:hypothetical protein
VCPPNNFGTISGFNKIRYGRHAVEGNLDVRHFNLAHSTIPKWRTFKLWFRAMPYLSKPRNFMCACPSVHAHLMPNIHANIFCGDFTSKNLSVYISKFIRILEKSGVCRQDLFGWATNQWRARANTVRKLRFHKRRRISWLAEWLLASQEGLCPVDLFH